jgi:CRISPR-associated endonuclease/helicase Cas3
MRPPARVIRRHDFLSLFSSEPDLAGGFTEVSRFVRDREHETDVYVFWREFQDKPSQERRPRAEEICSAPIGELRDFLQKNAAWEWNGELRQWERRTAREIRPGMTLLLACDSGGYDAQLGWTGDAGDRPVSLAGDDTAEPASLTSDDESETVWVPLIDHLDHAEAQCPSVRGISTAEESAVRLALRWHDVGKVHPKWQGAIAKAGLKTSGTGPWAKFPKTRSFRPGLRHEAASALAAWQKWIAGEKGWTALAVYLIAAHHGKVRTVLRTRIKKEADGDDVFGVKAGDTLALTGWLDSPCLLDLSPKLFGGSGQWEEAGFRLKAPAWVEVVSALLDSNDGGRVVCDSEPKALGPFRLAMLEACVTIADICASRAEERGK